MKGRKYIVEAGASYPRLYMTVGQLADYEGRARTTIYEIIEEIEEQVRAGRYPKISVADDPKAVSIYVWMDYKIHRAELKSGMAKKHIASFNPAEIAYLCPLVREIVVMEE